jgi:glycosyltransferase involved in cell wall biosynthesis
VASPQIDIIVPALASADELDRCLSKLDSFVPPFMDKHWIVADDAGKDQVAEVATFFAKTRAHVTVFRNEKKLYMARTVNRALGYTRGKFHIVCMTGVMLEDKGLLDKLLYPFMRDAKAVLTAADCRRDWNSYPPYRIERLTDAIHPDLWAVTRAGLDLLGPLDSSLPDYDAFEAYQREAAKIANAWVIPNVRTMTAGYEWPKRLPHVEELDRRAVSSPTILAQR